MLDPMAIFRVLQGRLLHGTVRFVGTTFTRGELRHRLFFRALAVVLGVWSLGFRVLGFKVQGLGFKVQGSGFRVQDVDDAGGGGGGEEARPLLLLMLVVRLLAIDDDTMRIRMIMMMMMMMTMMTMMPTDRFLQFLLS